MKGEIQHLQNLGLSAAEAKTYIALQELGDSKTGEISRKTEIPTSHLYQILDTLIKKGLVSYKYANRIKIYKASAPETLELLYTKKKQELEEQQHSLTSLIDRLSALPKEKETVSDYQYFENISGLKSLWIEFSKNVPPNSNVEVFGGKVETWERMDAIYLAFHRERKNKKARQRLLVPRIGAQKDKAKFIKDRKKIGLIDVRRIDTENIAEFATSDTMLIIQDTSRQTTIPRGFLIKDPIFIDFFRIIFNQLWNLGENV